MYINNFNISGCNRFALAGVQSIEIEPINPLQVIIGTNGCGKSTLLDFLSMPSTIEASAFSKGGSVNYDLTHKGHQYKIAAKVSPTPKYYFERDGVILNDWATGTVQKDLLKEHLGLDTKHKGVFTSNQTFHRMSAVQRREWFIQASDVDYSYALRIYSQLKDRLRDVQGALKLSRKRHAIEVEKLFKPEEVKQACDDALMLQQLLSLLIEYRQPQTQDDSAWIEKLQELKTKTISTQSKVGSITSSLRGYSQSHLPFILKNIDAAKAKMSISQAQMSELSKTIRILEEQLAAVKDTGQKSIKQIQQEIDGHQEQITALSSRQLVELGDSDPTALQQAYDSICTDLLTLFAELPPNEDGKYSRVKLEEAEKSFSECSQNLQACSDSVKKINVSMDHMLAHKDNSNVTCPKCDHTFSTKFDERTFNVANRQHSKLLVKQHALSAQLQQCKEYIEQAVKVQQSYRMIQGIQKACQALNPYWTWLDIIHCMKSPQTGVNRLTAISHDLEIQKKNYLHKQEHKKKTAQLQALNNLGVENIKSLQETQRSRIEAYEKYTSEYSQANKMFEYYTDIRDQLNQVSLLAERLSQLRQSYRQNVSARVEDIRRSHYNALVKQVQSLLGAKEYLLSQANHQQTIVTNLETQISELVNEEKCCAHAVKILSPTDGLIAKSITSFIDSFVAQMNQILERIFTYRVQIAPCAVSEEADGVELDYKFPVMVQNETVPDVSCLSKGQAEAVDLAFLVVSMCSMKMNDYPLILDEIGNALDSVHKVNFIGFLKDLLDNNIFQQIFLVSHDHAQYTSIKADYLVIDPTNVIVPQHHSTHAQVKKN